MNISQKAPVQEKKDFIQLGPLQSLIPTYSRTPILHLALSPHKNRLFALTSDGTFQLYAKSDADAWV